MANYQITKRHDSEVWTILREGASRASGTASTKEEAEKMAKDFCKITGGGEVSVHQPDHISRNSDKIIPARHTEPVKA